MVPLEEKYQFMEFPGGAKDGDDSECFHRTSQRYL